MLKLAFVLLMALHSPACATDKVEGTRGRRREQEHPCELCRPGQQWKTANLDNPDDDGYGKNCRNFNDLQENTLECIAAVASHAEENAICCEDDQSFHSRIDSINAHAVCDFCNGRYPEAPAFLWTTGDYGIASCRDYLEAGLLGRLSSSVCVQEMNGA